MKRLSYISPKAEVRESPIRGKGLFAKDPIPKDEIVCAKGGHIDPREELTHDWAMTDDDDYEMECRCGAENCREIITGKDCSKSVLLSRYEGHCSEYLVRRA